MHVNQEEHYIRFMDTIKLTLLLWRDTNRKEMSALAKKLCISERTLHRRFREPQTITLDELYAWCEFYGKDPAELLRSASRQRDAAPRRANRDVRGDGS